MTQTLPRRRSSDATRSTRDPEAMQLYAMPPGESVQRLRSDFVRLDKVLATMDVDRFTGYLRLHSETLNGVVLLHDGGVVESLFDMAPVVVTGKRALGIVGAAVSEGEGELDIVAMGAETVIGLYQLLTAPSLYVNLFARFVDVPALLAHLEETGVSGSLIVTDGGDQGIVLLREGEILTAYTARSVAPESAPEMLNALCEAPGAAIEVRAAPLPGAPPRMELAEALEMGAARDLRGEVAALVRTRATTAIPGRVNDADFEAG